MNARIFVAETEQEALRQAQDDFGPELDVKIVDNWTDWSSYEIVGMCRDPDVLDTWFSSALWPFATLGWPEDDQSYPSQVDGEDRSLLARHYPNDLLISGFDILFFWDARMAMMGMHFMPGGEGRPVEDSVPWRRLYLHGLVRAADGQKMSKSKGNVVDPLLLIDRYGADALRFFMASMESQGRDVKMDEKRVEGYRNFATKLWNAARFCQANGIGASQTIAAPQATLAVNKWIVGEVVETLAELDKAMADLRFDAAANAIYHFVWDRFCDWYLEAAKSYLQDEDTEETLVETQLIAGWVLDQILVMLHPFMPFVTEELWSTIGERKDENGEPCRLITSKWPEPKASVDIEAKRDFEWVIKLVSAIRGARTEMNVPPGAKISMTIGADSDQDENRRRLPMHPLIERLARLSEITMTGSQPSASTISVVVDGVTYWLSLEGVIDIAAERARLVKALEASNKEAEGLEGRLNNPAFVEKAKPEAVEKARADRAAHAAEAERLALALARLG